MGCLQSKNDISDQHPNVFRVINVDEDGMDLCSGQLEITDMELILYRDGRDSVVWPLHSLRRFGFDSELFSFEAGRRCETGEGIYAFKCRRTSLLFRVLHQRIYQRNRELENMPIVSSTVRQVIQADVVNGSSIANVQPDILQSTNSNPGNILSTYGRAQGQSSPSLSSADILEVMPLYPRPPSVIAQVTNLYQVKDFKREHNNNQSEGSSDGRHVYCNDINRDLAILRNNLKREAALNIMKDIEEETRFLQGRCLVEVEVINHTPNPKSPTMSNASEHYAQLSIENQDSRLYVNVTPNENNQLEGKQSDTAPPTPLTPKQAEYSNLLVGIKSEINTYANLTVGDLSEKIRNSNDNKQKISESDTLTSISPVEELEVNYAVLDIDSNNEAQKAARDFSSPDSQSISSINGSDTSSCYNRHVVVSQNSFDLEMVNNMPSSPQTAHIGYTSIDFAATSALSSVVPKADIFHCEGNRRNRHNSCTISCGSGSPGSIEKCKGNN